MKTILILIGPIILFSCSKKEEQKNECAKNRDAKKQFIQGVIDRGEIECDEQCYTDKMNQIDLEYEECLSQI